MFIKQANKEVGRLGALLTRFGKTKIKLDVDLLDNDINKYTKMRKESKNKYDDANLKGIVIWLKSVRDEIEEMTNDLSYNWSINKDDKCTLESEPIKFKDLREYKCDLTDYIVTTEDKKLYRFKYRDLSNIIAFELMYRDLGLKDKELEERMRCMNSVAIYKVADLKKVVKDLDLCFLKSKITKVKESAYYSLDKKKIVDYFRIKEYSIVNGYRDVVEFSARHAMTQILEIIIEGLVNFGVKFEICNVGVDEIDVLIDSDFDINRLKIEDVVIRVFGRAVELDREIEIY